jgi:hypothetical protein
LQTGSVHRWYAISKTVRIGWVVKCQHTPQSRQCPSCRCGVPTTGLCSQHIPCARDTAVSVDECACCHALWLQCRGRHSERRTRGRMATVAAALRPAPLGLQRMPSRKDKARAGKRRGKTPGVLVCCFSFGLQNAVSFLLAPLPRKRGNLMPSEACVLHSGRHHSSRRRSRDFRKSAAFVIYIGADTSGNVLFDCTADRRQV